MKLHISTLVGQLWINSFAIYIYIWKSEGRESNSIPIVSVLFYRNTRGKLWMHAVGYTYGYQLGSLPSVSLIPSHAANYHIYKTALFHIQPWKLPAKRRGAWLIFNLDSLFFFFNSNSQNTEISQFYLKHAPTRLRNRNFCFSKFRIKGKGEI